MRRNKRNYRTYKWYEEQATKLLSDETTQAYYENVKERFGLGTTTSQRMKEKGLSKLEIRKYWHREYDIATGKYEDTRNKQYVQNYIKALRRNNVDEELIQELEKQAKYSKRKRSYIIYHLPDLPLWGYVNVKDTRIMEQPRLSEEQIEENLEIIEEILETVKQDIRKEIDINKVKR